MSRDRSRLVLASSSPIRRRLLTDAGFVYEAVSPPVDESSISAEGPAALAETLALAKARSIADHHPDAVVIGSDQVFTLDGRFMPKPATIEEAAQKLRLMSGRSHTFFCGLAVLDRGEVIDVGHETATVTFHHLDAEEIAAYAATGEGVGCAGAYRLEERGVQLIESIEGSHFTVLGLPMLRLMRILREANLLEELTEERSAS